MCTKEGVIFDILNIMPYVRKHKKNPVTGDALAPKDLVRLNVSKNADGKWHCPVTFKVRPPGSTWRAFDPPSPSERDAIAQGIRAFISLNYQWYIPLKRCRSGFSGDCIVLRRTHPTPRMHSRLGAVGTTRENDHC